LNDGLFFYFFLTVILFFCKDNYLCRKITAMKKNLILSFFIFLSATTMLRAWDVVGHRIVADVAYQTLTGKARKMCDKVLGEKGLLYEASWADNIKSDAAFDYASPWHYRNLPDNLADTDLQSYLEEGTSEGEHLFWAIGQMKSRLLKNNSDDEALKFLVHFIGDMHQPLHLGRADDLGANRIKIKWFGEETNLHALWDGKLIESKRMSSSEYAEYLLNKFAANRKGDLNITMFESLCKIYAARNTIYSFDYSQPFNSYHYIYRYSGLADEMLYRGGVMLARILNEIYR
jgi:hypothetical protein